MKFINRRLFIKYLNLFFFFGLGEVAGSDHFCTIGRLKFYGDYESSKLTLNKYDQVIRYESNFYKLRPNIELNYTTSGTDERSWIADSVNFVRLDIKEINNLDFKYYSYCATPEMFGAVGDGIVDDSEAMGECFSSHDRYIVLNDNATYLWTKKKIVNGKIVVDAGNATIKCDGNFLEVVNGAGSKWIGGVLSSISTPFTVLYDNNWNINKSGFLGKGRMPFSDEIRIPSNYLNQKIGCALVFRSSDKTVQSGILVKGLKTNYGNIIVAGFKNTLFLDCKIRGGDHIAGISIINGTREALLWGYNSSVDDLSHFEYGRGSNHKVINCEVYESRNNGVYVSGSDHVLIRNCSFLNNGESGLKTAQYVIRDWTNTNCCCKDVTIINCIAKGQYYDGFDIQNVYGSGSGVFLDSYVTCFNNISIGNFHAGIVSQGGHNKIINCCAEGNGSHGIISKQSRAVEIVDSIAINNGQFWGGTEITLIGPDSKMQNCKAVHTKGNKNYLLINHQIGIQKPSLFGGNSINNVCTNTNKCLLGKGIELIQ